MQKEKQWLGNSSKSSDTPAGGKNKGIKIEKKTIRSRSPEKPIPEKGRKRKVKKSRECRLN